MRHRVPSVIAGAYLFLCIVLGGSTQGVWNGLALQLIGIVLIAGVGIAHARSDNFGTSVPVYGLILAGLLIVLLQMIPLPAGIWTDLPGREVIAQGLTALGYATGSAPVSETPFLSVMTLIAVIPALAAFLATERLGASPRAIAFAIIAGMVLSILLAAIQAAGGASSWAHFYKNHTPGATGFFANGNHMATLLLAGIPMTGALIVWARSSRGKSNSFLGIAIAFLVLAIVGVVLNGARAALGLSVPVILATFALFAARRKWRATALAASAITFLAGVYLLTVSPIAPVQDQPGARAGLVSRTEIWSNTASAIRDSFPVGTGLGSFERVYHRYENPDQVTFHYVNHAHNDLLELVLELGLPGVLLLAAALLWWFVATVRIWTTPAATVFARAATIATGAILVHSLVDFPLRMPAIAAVFGACIAVMTRYRAGAAAEAGELRASRHVSIG